MRRGVVMVVDMILMMVIVVRGLVLGGWNFATWSGTTDLRSVSGTRRM